MAKKHKRTDLRRIPRSQVDVDKAWARGRDDGLHTMMALFLWCWVEDFAATDEDVVHMGERLHYYLTEIHDGRLSIADIESAMDIEHKWRCELTGDAPC